MQKLKKAIIEALQEGVTIIDSKINIVEELDGFIHPTIIKFGNKDAQVIARNITKKLKRNQNEKT